MARRNLTLVSMTILSLLLAGPARSADLQIIRSAANATVYINWASVARDEGRSTVWSVWDHASDQVNLHGETYRSAALHNEYDCRAGTIRLLEIAEFAGPLAKGGTVRTYPASDSTPRPITPQSVASDIFEVVCGRGAIRDEGKARTY
jgi:hypothetical protein